MINFENIESKLSTVVSLSEWKTLESAFNSSKTIILIGHGGNLAVADHASIDISRLTDKTCLAPGSGIITTSLISDVSFESWLTCWMEILLRSLDLSSTIVIGVSCSVGTPSSKAIINALQYAGKEGVLSFLISARTKPELSPDANITTIVTNSIYYHTSEVLSLMLFYHLIHQYTDGKNPPPIRTVSNTMYVECNQCDNGNLDHDWCDGTGTSSAHVPPGFSNDLKNIAIDFDGVIHTFDKGFHDGTCYGEPIEGAIDAIKELSKDWNVIIFSAKCREDRPLIHGKIRRP